MNDVSDDESIIEIIRLILDERQPLWGFTLSLVLLITLTTGLLYPGGFWFIPLISGLLAIIGFGFKKRVLVTIGIVLIGAVIFLRALPLQLTPLVIMVLIGLFVVLYSAIVYMNDLVRTDMILKDSEDGIKEIHKRYSRKRNVVMIKNMSLAFFLAFIAFMTSWTGTLEFWIEMENIFLLGISGLIILLILFLLYVVFVKFLSLYEPE